MLATLIVVSLAAARSSLPALGRQPASEETFRIPSLYVADAQRSTVLRYRLHGDVPVQPAAGTLQLASSPSHLAIGPAGTLFVSYAASMHVDVFAGGAVGSAKPLRTLLLKRAPNGIAVDAAGYLYVTGLERNTVSIFSPGTRGHAKPFALIAGPTGTPTTLVALDPQGRLFFGQAGSGYPTIFEYADPLTNPTIIRSITFNFSVHVSAVAVDVMHETYVAQSAIAAYSPSACCFGYPADRTIAPASGPFAPVAIAIRNRHAFVASNPGSQNGAVDTFDIFGGTQTPLSVVAGSYLPAPVAVAVDP